MPEITGAAVDTSKFTIINLRRFERSAAFKEARREVLQARKIANETCAKVDAYVAPIFANFKFVSKFTGRAIAMPRELYLVDMEQAQPFFDACDVAHRRHGYHLPEGHCPALVAEIAAYDKEKQLLKVASSFFGFDFTIAIGDDRAKTVELLLNPPGIKLRS